MSGLKKLESFNHLPDPARSWRATFNRISIHLDLQRFSPIRNFWEPALTHASVRIFQLPEAALNGWG